MSKMYEAPTMEIEKFRFEDILTVSGGMGDGDAGADKDGMDGDTDSGFVGN
jgi:hypothetical protein